MTAALLIVDIQNDYFPGGAYPLVGADSAVARARDVLVSSRAAGVPVVHVQHVWDAPDAAFMVPGTPGVEIHPAVAPADGEPTVRKAHPNAFRETGLQSLLGDLGVERLVVCGMMSNLCVDSTVRAAADLGYEVELVHDACAASDLAFDGRTLPGDLVHATFMAGLGEFARVLSADDYLADPAR
jgi:nicotinamidase-related amidase